MKRSLWVVLGALSLIFAACSPASEGPVKGGRVVFALNGSVSVLDPALAYDFTLNPVINQITEGLVRLDAQGQVVPNLATKWETPDLLTYVFSLRPGVTFHDGSPLKASDVVYSLRRIVDKGTASPMSWFYQNVASFDAVGETVVVHLKAPEADLLFALATTAGHVVPEAWARAQNVLGALPAGLVGTGPFRFEGVADGVITLARNENYWDQAHGPWLEKVVFQPFADDESRLIALRTGEVDASAPVPADAWADLRGRAGLSLQTVSAYSDDWVAFNTGKGPFRSHELRQAAVASFDSQSFVASFVKDNGEFAHNNPIGPSLWLVARDAWKTYDGLSNPIAYDLGQARKLREASGTPPGTVVKLVTDGEPLRLLLAQNLKLALDKIGLKVEIEQVSSTDLTARQFSGARDYDLILGSWGADFPDPAAIVLPFFLSDNRGEGGSNFANYQNPQVDNLLRKVARTADPLARNQGMVEALTLASTDAPYLFIDHPKVAYASTVGLKGYTLSPVWYWDAIFREAWLTPTAGTK